MKCAVVVPAAGSGSRFGGELPKQFVALAGRPLIAHTLSRLDSFEAVTTIVVPAAPEHFDRIEAIFAAEGLTRCRVVEGGASRAESVLRGLMSLESSGVDSIVAVHDAVRPFPSRKLFDRLLFALGSGDGSFPGLVPADTVHMVENGLVMESLPRERLVGAQTPQCFRLGMVRDALEDAIRAGFPVTDEVSAVVRLGYRVVMVEGDPDNFKITNPEDLDRARRLLGRRGD